LDRASLRHRKRWISSAQHAPTRSGNRHWIIFTTSDPNDRAATDDGSDNIDHDDDRAATDDDNDDHFATASARADACPCSAQLHTD
jgi:hypothetical protein